MECRELTLSRTRVLPRSSQLSRSPRRGYQRNERRVSIQWLLCATNDLWPAVLKRTGMFGDLIFRLPSPFDFIPPEIQVTLLVP
jgi:hypothetical protein